MKRISKPGKSAFLFTLLFSVTTYSQIILPKLISDGMVLQRDSKIKIWGWAAKNEKISIQFMDSIYHTTANQEGEWQVLLLNLKAGGPYTMQINASNTITINNIMIGDVWLCSGQSNMELPMKRVSWVYESEIENADNTFIRHFEVPDKYDFNAPQKDLESGKWENVNLENILHFSAVAYFFAKELYEKYQVPIGLIDASLGGSPVEAWMSESCLKSFPVHYEEAQRFKDSKLIKQIIDQDNKRIRAWTTLLRQKDKGYQDPKNRWIDPDLNTSDWETMNVPGYWLDTDPDFTNGAVWFRKKIHISSSMSGKEAKLILGRIVDADSVFFNGVFIGTTTYQYPPRRYDIPSELLQEGENTIVVRVVSQAGKGGFVLDKPYEIVSGQDTVDLKGGWQYHLGAKMEPLASQTFIRWKPLGLYNAMIAPLLNYRIKGVIWYQGESNAERPVEYRTLFPSLIQDWRINWNQGDFPFLFVQLANFMEVKSEPAESNWALLREAQMSALSLPETGMAVTIDLGEWNDIHPLNKKDVGKRLALAAQKVAYGDEKVVYSGPMYESMQRKGNKIRLSFTHVGSGLICKDADTLNHFAIAGADSQFVWAHAEIEGNQVIVWHEDIQNPFAVRYAWADNPQSANLYNREGLPASPFRTDDF